MHFVAYHRLTAKNLELFKLNRVMNSSIAKNISNDHSVIPSDWLANRDSLQNSQPNISFQPCFNIIPAGE